MSGQFQICKRKIVERNKIDTYNTQYMTAHLSGLVQVLQ